MFGHVPTEKEVAKAWAHKRAREVVDRGGAAQVLVRRRGGACDETASPAHRPAHRGRALQERDPERAASEGVALGDLALHLTLGDVELLKRDRSLPVADISFDGGTMRYLGVKVVKGDTSRPASLSPPGRRRVPD